MIIKITTPDGTIDEFDLDKTLVVIGRGQSCDIVIADDHISRKHLEISCRENLIIIKDLTLSNWVSYNDEKMPKSAEVEYYDFAPLLLPGNYRVEIESLELDSNGKVKGKKVLSDIDDDIDIYRNPVNDKALGSKENKKRFKKLPRNNKFNNKKNLKELLLMLVAAVIVIGFIVNQFFMNDDVQFKSSRTQRIKKPKPKRIVKRKNLPKLNLKKIKKDEMSENTSKVNEDLNGRFEKILRNELKCNSISLQKHCDKVLSGKINNEGIYQNGNSLFIVKDYAFRGEKFFKTKDLFLNTSIPPETLQYIIAGAEVLLPSFLKKIEEDKIKEVFIILYDSSEAGITLKSKYRINVSDYRKFGEDKYSFAYSQILNKKDSRYFEVSLQKYIEKL